MPSALAPMKGDLQMTQAQWSQKAIPMPRTWRVWSFLVRQDWHRAHAQAWQTVLPSVTDTRCRNGRQFIPPCGSYEKFRSILGEGKSGSKARQSEITVVVAVWGGVKTILMCSTCIQHALYLTHMHVMALCYLNLNACYCTVPGHRP